ncbi:MAG: NADH-quinone oxidoreductase subunit M, partial [Gammaproteobacteria bacterium]|nr:NADH-quinone oxidoreductase subunit M [Gammaproteobacteria bacterium]
DLFLFFLFWELMLIPMFLVIAVWGHEQRQRAALKFMLYTQGSGLLLLLAIVSLALLHREHAGRLSFDYPELLAMPLDPGVSPWLMLGFFLAFAVKLPVVPLHTWLPDAHTQAPTAGSVLLAGILLKTGAYGLMRFVIPLFPDAAAAFAPVALGLGLTGIVYGAVLAFAQRDAKRLVAYSSISHLGFVLIGVFVWNTYALLGSVLQMLAHGISSAGLFILAGVLQQRLGSRDMAAMGGLQAQMPRLAAMGLCFALAALGLPGLGNFVAEFLVLLGTYQVSVLTSSVALAALVLAPIYALALMQRVFHGPTVQKHRPPADIGAPTLPTLGLLLLASLWLGLHPQPVLDVVQPAMTTLQSLPATTTVAGEANLGKLP